MTPMTVDLDGLSAVITGGGTGIGKAISVALARCGAKVTIGYRNSREDAELTRRTILDGGGDASVYRCDVTKDTEVRRLIEHARMTCGKVDILMANAGGPLVQGLTHELNEIEWQAELAANCSSVFLCVRHVTPVMSDGRGRIIVTSSISARSGAGPGSLPYAAAKGAVNNMVRNWAKELAPRGITVNAIAPGIIRTRIHEKGTDPDEYRRLIERVPLARDGLPEDCVGAVLLLASEEGSYITGQTIEINGGMQMP